MEAASKDNNQVLSPKDNISGVRKRKYTFKKLCNVSNSAIQPSVKSEVTRCFPGLQSDRAPARPQ